MTDLRPAEAKALGHFRRRLSERYGITKITRAEWQTLKTQISNGHKNFFVGRTSGSKTWWLVDIRDQKVLALYCSKTRGFLSCLPLNVIRGALEKKPRDMRYLGMTLDSIMVQRSHLISKFLGKTG